MVSEVVLVHGFVYLSDEKLGLAPHFSPRSTTILILRLGEANNKVSSLTLYQLLAIETAYGVLCLLHRPKEHHRATLALSPRISKHSHVLQISEPSKMVSEVVLVHGFVYLSDEKLGLAPHFSLRSTTVLILVVVLLRLGEANNQVSSLTLYQLLAIETAYGVLCLLHRPKEHHRATLALSPRISKHSHVLQISEPSKMVSEVVLVHGFVYLSDEKLGLAPA